MHGCDGMTVNPVGFFFVRWFLQARPLHCYTQEIFVARFGVALARHGV